MGEKKLCYGCMQMKSAQEHTCLHCGYAEGSPYDPNYITPGTVLNERYAVGAMIGHNSEGATYIGYNKSIGCRVLIREYMPQGLCVRVKGKAVISVNPNQVVQYKALMAEFTELNKALAQMRGTPHINPVLDLFATNNTTYAVYEYLEGIKLVDYLKENAGELTWKQVSEMFPPFFTTLSLMHNSGVIHRAISPDTIYVTEKGDLRLCGFSIATVRTVHTELPCEIFHGYAAPEQYSPTGRQGNWTDVYGICAVLYRILTGCKPTDAPSRLDNDNLCNPHEMNPSIPWNVSRVIMKGLSLFSNDRIQSVTELVTQLFDHEEIPAVTPTPAPEPQYRQHSQTTRHAPQPAPAYQDYEDDDYDDYDVEDRDNVIDRIRIPIIIGVLLTCVLLVIAIVVLNFLDMGPFGGKDDSTIDPTAPIMDTVDNVVTEPFTDETLATEANGDSLMPNLVGHHYEAKKKQFEESGWLYLEATYEYSDEYDRGIIISQELEPGESFVSGSIVKVVVSNGPSSIIIPEYTGKMLKDYEAELEALGLTNYTTEAVENYSYKTMEVIELNKEAGETFDLTGTETLKIYYANNPETQPATAAPTDPPTEAPTEAPPATEAPADPPATAAPTDPPVQETEPDIGEPMEGEF